MDKFNNLYKDFLNTLEDTFPSYKKYFVYTETSQNLIFYTENILPYIEDISVRNVDAFKYKHMSMQIVRGLKFKRLLEDKRMTQRVLETIWRFLHNLYIVAYNSCDLRKVIRKRDDLINILDNHDILVENIMLSGHVIVEERNNSSEESEEEISEEEENLRKEFERERQGDNNNKNDGDDMCNKTDSGEVPNLESMFEGSMLGKIAKELTEEMGEDLTELQNPGDLLSSILNPGSGNGGDNKLQNIMSKIMTTMDNKMKNGEFNQQQMMNEAQQMMGTLGPMLGGASGEDGGMDISSMMGQMMGQQTQQNRKQRRRKQRGRK